MSPFSWSIHALGQGPAGRVIPEYRERLSWSLRFFAGRSLHELAGSAGPVGRGHTHLSLRGTAGQIWTSSRRLPPHEGPAGVPPRHQRRLRCTTCATPSSTPARLLSPFPVLCLSHHVRPFQSSARRQQIHFGNAAPLNTK